ncbi:hypothetical protein DBV15_00665 [Temnothorax longispinosus]|uniref:Uncharacterized protein n=1 Tax=Temnothorax longispinosus TaxID=300112 RepID=A0A4S2KN67_9HYME|nr:hypothetical protein DBV15_00665 [Temnothorax longispinosus]
MRGHRGRSMGFKCRIVAKSEISRSRLGDKWQNLSVGLRKARNGPGQLIKQTRCCRLRCLHSHAFADFCLAINSIALEEIKLKRKDLISRQLYINTSHTNNIYFFKSRLQFPIHDGFSVVNARSNEHIHYIMIIRKIEFNSILRKVFFGYCNNEAVIRNRERIRGARKCISVNTLLYKQIRVYSTDKIETMHPDK